MLASTPVHRLEQAVFLLGLGSVLAANQSVRASVRQTGLGAPAVALAARESQARKELQAPKEPPRRRKARELQKGVLSIGATSGGKAGKTSKQSVPSDANGATVTTVGVVPTKHGVVR